MVFLRQMHFFASRAVCWRQRISENIGKFDEVGPGSAKIKSGEIP
jgi:hypothetical protein